MKFQTPVEAARQLPDRHITVLARTNRQPANQLDETLRTLGRSVTLHQITLELGDEATHWLPPEQIGREKHFRATSAADTRPAGLGFALLTTVQQQGSNVLAVPHPSTFEPDASGEVSVLDQKLRETLYNGALFARDRASQIGYPLWLLIAGAGENGQNEGLHVISPLITDTSRYTFPTAAPVAVL